MLWATLIIQLIPVIIKLIDIAEKLWVERDTGPQKKEMVTLSLKEMVLQKGTLDDWLRIEKAIDGIVDASCMVMFPNKNKGEELE